MISDNAFGLKLSILKKESQ